MNIDSHHNYSTHGDGTFDRNDFKFIGENVIFEKGVLVFHPENISIGNNVYIGHNTILKGYHRNEMHIGDHTWIGQGCFFHSAGGLKIGKAVGIGPKVNILTSEHSRDDLSIPVMFNELVFSEVIIADGADIGIATTILPGVHIGEGTIIGASAVVNIDIPPYNVAAGVPCRIIADRGKSQ